MFSNRLRDCDMSLPRSRPSSDQLITASASCANPEHDMIKAPAALRLCGATKPNRNHEAVLPSPKKL
jgi:hypothetical protein